MNEEARGDGWGRGEMDGERGMGWAELSQLKVWVALAEEARLAQATEHDAPQQLIRVAGPSELQHHMGLAFHDSADRRFWHGTRQEWTSIVDIIIACSLIQRVLRWKPWRVPASVLSGDRGRLSWTCMVRIRPSAPFES
jgi:hypothetical protein